MHILIVDNFDSFTYNLVHYLEKDERVSTDVVRNHMLDGVQWKEYDRIVLSPGPGLPSESGGMNTLIKDAAGRIPILGICLGLQGIAEAFGGKLFNLSFPDHGVSRKTIVKDGHEILFRGIPAEFNSGRYHSWAVERESLPDCFRITAEDEKGVIMALSHKDYDMKGIQFHPESIMTGCGQNIITNWLSS